MAIATERWKDRLITKANGKWKATMGWDVVQFVDELDAYNAIPFSVGDPHPLEDALMLASFTPTRVGLTMISIKANFEVPVDGYFEGAASPLDQLERYEWLPGGTNLPIDRDSDGNAITTSAGVPAKGVSNFFKTRFLHVRRYEPFYDAALAQEYEDTVNSVPFQIAGFGSVAAGQLILRTYAPTHDYTSKALWVHVEYIFEFNPNGFQARIIDADRMAVDSNGKIQQILDKSGNPVAKDVMLNGKGAPLQPGFWVGAIGTAAGSTSTPAGATIDQQASAVFLKYNIKGQTDFTTLSL